MSTVQEVENAIQLLPREKIFFLREVIQHRFDDEWDRQFVDELAKAALAEHRAGKSTPLPRDEK